MWCNIMALVIKSELKGYSWGFMWKSQEYRGGWRSWQKSGENIGVILNQFEGIWSILDAFTIG